MSGFADIVMDDAEWIDFLDDVGPVIAAAELRRLLKSLGLQENLRVQGISAARDDESIPESQIAAMRTNLKLWKRSIARIRTKAQQRHSQVRPSAAALIDSHQADRRALVILAKRLWLWEEGADYDGLDDALDVCTISTGTSEEAGGRMTLRELVKDIAAQGKEITP